MTKARRQLFFRFFSWASAEGDHRSTSAAVRHTHLRPKIGLTTRPGNARGLLFLMNSHKESVVVDALVGNLDYQSSPK